MSSAPSGPGSRCSTARSRRGAYSERKIAAPSDVSGINGRVTVDGAPAPVVPFGGEADRYGNEGAIGMDIMEMMNDMPLVSVLLFQQRELPQPAEKIVDGLLKQVHSMS